ncbi:MAG TPA: response regulator [Candidatus Ozemobacteraceae bacterium]|nr:response regulator [Candidatus Ozemobacteraceae bacterium]
MSEAREILIIDDCRNIRLTVQTALEADGWDVAGAGDGEEGFALLKTGRFRLALLDLQLPGMDGIEVLRRIRKINSGIAIVIITAYGTVANSVEAMKLGAIDFLQKPFSPDTLRTLVREIMSQPLSIDPSADVSPRSSGEFLVAARTAMRSGNYRTAEKHLQEAAKRDARNPETFNLLGVTLEVGGNQLEAQKFYRAALSLDPGFEPARGNLERLILNRGKGPILLGT